jgi:phosphoserine aminotransferase
MFLDYCYKHNIVGLRTNTPFCYKFLAINEPLRISLYNNITIEELENMVKVMKSFQNLFCK